MLESIFELFVQSKRTLDRSAAGSASGLTLVRSLVAMHGGMVTVHSDGEGKGSEFVVRLPLTTEAVRIEPPASRPARDRAWARAPRSSSSRTTPTAASCSASCSRTRASNAQPPRAASPGSALIDELPPPIAILDVGLPEMDGFEIARRLRSKPEHANIFLIALTGYGQARTEPPAATRASTSTWSSP